MRFFFIVMSLVAAVLVWDHYSIHTYEFHCEWTTVGDYGPHSIVTHYGDFSAREAAELMRNGRLFDGQCRLTN